MSSNVNRMAFSDLTPTGEEWHPWHSDRQLAYHGPFSYLDSMKESALGGMTIGVEPIVFAGRIQTGKNMLVWKETGDVVGFCSKNYKPIQPADLVGGFLDGMGTSTDAQIFHTAGILNDGRFWALIHLADERFQLNVGGSKILTYLCMYGINDGKHACLIFPTRTRVECQNTMEGAVVSALMGTQPLVSLAHKSGVEDAIKAAPLILGQSVEQVASAQGAYDALAGKQMAGSDFENFVKFLLPSKVETHPDGNTAANVDAERAKVMRAFDDPKNYNAAWKGSWLQAYSTMADYLTHLRQTVKRNGKSKSLFDSVMFGGNAKMLATAMTYCLTKVGFSAK